ncbi:MAG: hypothetical protein ACTHJW_20000 [Streptosporangiaceae bacterium]
MSEQLARALAAMLHRSASLLPARRRHWAEAVAAEAAQMSAGLPRLRWLAGGLWLVAREASMARRIGYGLGVAAVAAAAVWTMWLSWRTNSAADPENVTDRARVLAGAAALIVLPWVGRRRGWFGPPGSSITMRLLRVAGCAAICALGVSIVRNDRHAGINGVLGYGKFSWLHELAGLAFLALALAGPALMKARWQQLDEPARWSIGVVAGVTAFFLLPIQLLAACSAALVLAGTSRRSPARPATLTVGASIGVATGLIMWWLATILGELGGAWFLLMPMAALLAGFPAGLASGWLLSGDEDPQRLRAARIRQGQLGGAAAGAVCGLVLTAIFIGIGVMLLIGPLAGMAGGACGGAISADHRRWFRPGRSQAAEAASGSVT